MKKHTHTEKSHTNTHKQAQKKTLRGVTHAEENTHGKNTDSTTTQRRNAQTGSTEKYKRAQKHTHKTEN